MRSDLRYPVFFLAVTLIFTGLMAAMAHVFIVRSHQDAIAASANDRLAAQHATARRLIRDPAESIAEAGKASVCIFNGNKLIWSRPAVTSNTERERLLNLTLELLKDAAKAGDGGRAAVKLENGRVLAAHSFENFRILFNEDDGSRRIRRQAWGFYLLAVLISVFMGLIAYVIRAPVRTSHANPEEPDRSEATLLRAVRNLYEKPFPRMKSLEIAIFPRHPLAESTNFIAAGTGEGYTDILAAHYDICNLDSVIIKHRLQERFLAMTRTHADAHKTGETLWQLMLESVEFGPGLLYARIADRENKVQFFRSGPFTVYEHRPGGRAGWLHSGSGYFATSFNGLKSYRLRRDSIFVIVSAEIPEACGLDEATFSHQILEKIHHQTPAARYLRELVGVVYNTVKPRGSEAEQIARSGLIAVISSKL